MISIKGYLQMSHTLATLPPGWSALAAVVKSAVALTQVRLSRIEIQDGVLYLEDDGTSKHTDVFQRFAKTILQESARTCMVCGVGGIRRKEQYGKPPLCFTHYAEYINEV